MLLKWPPRPLLWVAKRKLRMYYAFMWLAWASFPASSSCFAGMSRLIYSRSHGIRGSYSKKRQILLHRKATLRRSICVVALSSLAPLVLSVVIAAFAVTEGISLSGGWAIFGRFTRRLFNTQKVLERARLAESGVAKFDPVGESIRFELDAINIFIRIVQTLGMQQNCWKWSAWFPGSTMLHVATRVSVKSILY